MVGDTTSTSGEVGERTESNSMNSSNAFQGDLNSSFRDAMSSGVFESRGSGDQNLPSLTFSDNQNSSGAEGSAQSASGSGAESQSRGSGTESQSMGGNTQTALTYTVDKHGNVVIVRPRTT